MRLDYCCLKRSFLEFLSPEHGWIDQIGGFEAVCCFTQEYFGVGTAGDAGLEIIAALQVIFLAVHINCNSEDVTPLLQNEFIQLKYNDVDAIIREPTDSTLARLLPLLVNDENWRQAQGDIVFIKENIVWVPSTQYRL